MISNLLVLVLHNRKWCTVCRHSFISKVLRNLACYVCLLPTLSVMFKVSWSEAVYLQWQQSVSGFLTIALPRGHLLRWHLCSTDDIWNRSWSIWWSDNIATPWSMACPSGTFSCWHYSLAFSPLSYCAVTPHQYHYLFAQGLSQVTEGHTKV